MAVAITLDEVKAGFSTSVPDAEISGLIALANEADSCLDFHSVADDKQRLLKIYVVRHLLLKQKNSGLGPEKSQSSPAGGRGFVAASEAGATHYSDLIKQLDTHRCVISLIESNKSVLFTAVG